MMPLEVGFSSLNRDGFRGADDVKGPERGVCLVLLCVAV